MTDQHLNKANEPFSGEPTVPLMDDGHGNMLPDLNWLSDKKRSGEIRSRYASLSEALGSVGTHGLHIVNPDAHPDEPQSQPPDLALLRQRFLEKSKNT